jgi:hypothetical protein
VAVFSGEFESRFETEIEFGYCSAAGNALVGKLLLGKGKGLYKGFILVGFIRLKFESWLFKFVVSVHIGPHLANTASEELEDTGPGWKIHSTGG